MGTGTRIRWQNVAKLAAGVAGCVALVAGLPALLDRPQPPPLPAGIGLTHVRDRAPGAALSAARAVPRHAKSRPARVRGHDVHPERRREPDPQRREPGHRHDPPAPDATPVVAPSPAPAPSPPAPTPAPAPAYSPPPPAPAPTPV